jgi:hypothetical protein
MKPLFPLPLYFGKRRYWRLYDLINYERELAGLAPLPPTDPASETYLNAAQVCERYGGVSFMWVNRRLAAAKAVQQASETAAAAARCDAPESCGNTRSTR